MTSYRGRSTCVMARPLRHRDTAVPRSFARGGSGPAAELEHRAGVEPQDAGDRLLQGAGALVLVAGRRRCCSRGPVSRSAGGGERREGVGHVGRCPGCAVNRARSPPAGCPGPRPCWPPRPGRRRRRCVSAVLPRSRARRAGPSTRRDRHLRRRRTRRGRRPMPGTAATSWSGARSGFHRVSTADRASSSFGRSITTRAIAPPTSTTIRTSRIHRVRRDMAGTRYRRALPGPMTPWFAVTPHR